MKNKKKVIILIAIVVFVAFVSGVLYAKGYFDSGIKDCPTAWIDNQMPTGGLSSDNSQYLKVDGARRETRDYNLNWIRNNCEVNEPSVVY